MDDKLSLIQQKLMSGTTGELDDEAFEYTNRLKFAITLLIDYPHKHRHELVETIKENYLDDELSSKYCYKLLSDAETIFPSIEKVNKAFEIARLMKFGYSLLNTAVEKKNMRDGAQLIKTLAALVEMAAPEDDKGTKPNVINIYRYSPESLGIKEPEGFDRLKFIEDLEREYDPRNTLDISHEEVG